MRYVVLVGLLLVGSGSALAATSKEGPLQSGAPGVPPPSPAPAQAAGRYQLIVVQGHSGSPFLLDTLTGCIWHQVQHEQTKRTTFVEVDVENLHWSWGSGAQQVLGGRIDASNLPDEQKRMLKESLQKTGCGLSNVVLTPGPPSQGQPTKTP